MIRTFIDSGVLIVAARGEGAIAERALAILEDSNPEFVSSIFLKLEVLPKAIYKNKTSEIKFYEEYFNELTVDITELTMAVLDAKSYLDTAIFTDELL
ncbi:hypothetical protein [Chlorogloeopsis sp. ULAP02]|uniref:hypothetical protein n=1 Tax=Chlorogloeopsis sp. ULAP02 TaxID=3107926 RepID=UPI003136F7D0